MDHDKFLEADEATTVDGILGVYDPVLSGAGGCLFHVHCGAI